MIRDCLDCHEPAVRGRSRCRYHEAVRQQRRNAQPARRALYGGSWREESRAIREEQPWCSVCGKGDDLTVDHPSRSVLCRKHHGELEARRRAQRSRVVSP